MNANFWVTQHTYVDIYAGDENSEAVQGDL